MAFIYTQEHIEYLKEITPGRWNKEITAMFNSEFGLNKTEKAISAVRKRNKINTGFDGQFKEGQEAWNKGTKGLMKANKTSFKKGNIPPNHRPVGSERINVDGYTEIKIAEPNKWQLKHRIIYEEHHGPIPEGGNIIFGDGNSLNLDVDNLILVSDKQLLKMNQYNLIQEDAKLTKTGVLIADLHLKMGERRKKD